MNSCVVDELRLGSAPDARAFFLLDRQKKEAKEKATPGRRPACGGVPCATRSAGRLRNSDLRPSDSPRRLPPAALRCSASSKGGKHRAEFDAHRACCPFGFPLALCVVEQRRAQREKGRGLSEDRRSEFRSPPVAAEQRRAPGAAGRRGGRAFFLGTSSWQDKKKYLACRRNPADQCRKVVRKLTRCCAPASAKSRGTAHHKPG